MSSKKLLLLAGFLIAAAILVLAPARAFAREELRIGLTGVYPPFNYLDPAGELAGFDVEVAKELCASLDRRCVFEVLQWDGILSALLAGRIDVVIGSMAITPEREEQVRFTTPYYESGAQIFVERGSERTPADERFRLGVTLGTTYGEVAAARFPDAAIRTYKSDVAALQDLQAGRLDGLITDKLVGLHMSERYQADLVPQGGLLFEERIGIPVHPSNQALLEELDAALAQLLPSPRYQALYERFFGGAGGAPTGEATFSWSSSVRLLLQALWATVEVSAAGILLGVVLAVILAALLILTPSWLSKPIAFYVDFIRSTPFLIQLFTLYFGLPVVGLELGAWSSAALAIGIHSSAYLSEIIKVAYQSIPKGQRDAARILGLHRREEIAHVIWPQMLPHLTAPSLNTLVATIKDSAIVSVISVHELTMQAQQLISVSFRPMEFYLLTACLYFLITYPLLLAGRSLEKRYRKQGSSMQAEASLLKLEGVGVRRGGRRIIEGLSLEVSRGEPFAIVGESGSGKTTLLYAATGLIPVEAGRIEILGKSIRSLGPRERSKLFGLVFQDYQLFPHLTARENVLLAPGLQGLQGADARADHLFDELRIAELADRRPHEMSGGQKQRVAIARSLVLQPSVLFFDEPSAALDAKTSEELADLLLAINRRTQTIVVSHDAAFIERCCGRGIRLEAGRITSRGKLDLIMRQAG